MEATAGRLLVSVAEAAELLGISERTLFTLTKSGELPSVRVRHRVMYRVATLEQWIAEREA